MKANVDKSILDQMTDEDKNKIKDIMQKNFSGKGIDDEIKNIDFVPISSDPADPNFSPADCIACDVGFSAAVTACNLLVIGAPVCIAIAAQPFTSLAFKLRQEAGGDAGPFWRGRECR